MIEIVHKENKEQANGNEGILASAEKNIRQVGDTNGRRIYLEDCVGNLSEKYFSAPEGRAAMSGESARADGISTSLPQRGRGFIR